MAMVDAGAPPPQSTFTAHLNVLLPGLYAWATTVGLPAMAAPAGGLAKLAAAGTALSLVSGSISMQRAPRLGRALAVHGFVGLSIVTWALLRRASVTLGAQSWQSAFGALGWMFYAFGWGELSARRRVPELNPHALAGPPLSPRNRWSLSVDALLGLGVAGAVALLFLAFRVERAPQAVMGHALALLLGLLCVAASTRVALGRGGRTMGSASERFGSSSSALAWLLIALGLGVLYWMLQH